MTGITRTLAEFIAGLTYCDLPDDVARRAKLLIFDTIGIALRARWDAASTDSLIRAVDRLGMRGETATVIGDSHRYTAAGAALINGALAHSLDFDDTHARGSIHASAPIVPAALAVAEEVGANGKQVIAAVVAGYEIQIRLSLALGPSDHYNRGFHPTATCGAFGAAAAASRIMGLSADQIDSAFGICLSQTAGSMQFLHDGAWTKRSHVGHAAMCGLVAATLAAEGYVGPSEAFEGRAGFFRSHAPNPEPTRAAAGLGEVWETMEIAVKPYPSCRYGHAPIDGLIALREEYGIKPHEIEKVKVGLSKTGLDIIGEPLADKQKPISIVDGQFSLPFVAAAALIEGGLGWDDYETLLANDNHKALWPKVEAVVDPEVEAEFPDNMAARVQVATKDGVFEKYIQSPRGEPDNFMTEDELRWKFEGLVSPFLDTHTMAAFADGMLSLEEAEDIRAL
ncbi:MAG: MmgE/PrpD family protein, partial [Rhodospirillaceae bacterium]|nr:MmgE/PrpD family protein [Rhodospirillaceae bacterium]